MAEKKYGEYVIKAPMGKSELHPELLPSVRFRDEKPWSDWRDINFSAVYNCITEPILMLTEAHKHDDFEQYLFFLGGNPTDVTDLGAEIELFLGEEGEKHIITTATIVRIPKGLYHGPLNFKRIERPMVFLDIFLAPGYKRKQISGSTVTLT